MKSKTISFQKRIFLLILSISVCISLIFFTALLIWQGTYYRKDRFKQFSAEVTSSFSDVEHALDNLSTLSLSIAYSSSVSDNYHVFFNSRNLDAEDSYKYFKELTEALIPIIGPSLSIPQVYIYNMDHSYFGYGIHHTSRIRPFHESLDFLDFSSIKGTTTYTLPHIDTRITNASIYEIGNHYISALRSIKNNLNATIGYVEVVQRYDTIFQSLEILQKNAVDVYVFSPDGELIYPMPDAPLNNPEDSAGVSDTASADDAETEKIFTSLSTLSEHTWNRDSRNNYSYFYRSDASDYYYVARINYGMLFSGFGTLVASFLAIFLFLIIVLSLICLQISHTFTRPIKALSDSIEHVELDSLEKLDFPILPTSISEIYQLNELIHDMAISINDYMDRLLLSKNQEIQTRILALQAQTNPHFIYNILFNISAMASVGMNDEIEDLCGKIRNLMHYCSSPKDSLVCLNEEIYYTNMYIDCMKIRFPHLESELNIPASAGEFRIPKLIVQLLVENAIKFCSTQAPPWKLTVLADLTDEHFTVSVSDNGAGFREDILEQLNEQFLLVKASHVLPDLELNGMGLLNVYLRLLLIYGEDTQILLQNNESGGATVILKIPLPKSV